VNERSRVVAFWIINSNKKVGFGKLLRKILPTNQIDILQIMVNDGFMTKLVLRNLEGDVHHNLQILWDRNVSQPDMRKSIRVILGHLNLKTEIEMAIISIYKKITGSYETRNCAVDMIDATEDLFNSEKILKWSIVKNWNDDRNITDWVKYRDLSPECRKFDEDWRPYNILRELKITNNCEQVIEVTLWSPDNITKYQKDVIINRNLGKFTIIEGKLKT
jgi:hypothetical protein